MDDQNNTNTQNPINPLDQTQIGQDTKPTEEIVNVNTQSIQNNPLQQEEKPKENENQSMDTQGFPQMDSSTPPPPPIPTMEENINEQQGTNAPNLDIPPVISTNNKPKKKFGGKTIATILGILLLVGGIGAGVILLNQQQDMRSKAGGGTPCQSNNDCPAGKYCLEISSNEYGKFCLDIDVVKNPPCKVCEKGACFDTGKEDSCSVIYNQCSSDGDCALGLTCGQECNPNGGRQCAMSLVCTHQLNGSNICCNKLTNDCCGGGVETEICSDGLDNDLDGKVDCVDPDCTNNSFCINPPINPPSSNPSNPPSSPPSPVVSCLNIKAYNTSWEALTLDELKELNSGDIVRLTVSGTATSGTFTKARFTINTVVKPETTTKKPDTNEFYIEYTIPENATDFSIDAQVYHSTKGWI